MTDLSTAHAERPAADSALQSRPSAPSLTRSISALASGQVVTWTLTIVWTLLVPRAIGPASMGVLVMAGAVTSILGLVLGVGNILYVVREAVARRSEAGRLVGATFLTRLALSPLFLGGVALYVGIRGYTGSQALVIYLVALAFILNTLQEPLRAGLQSIERMDYVALSTVVNSAGASIVAILLVLAGVKLTGIVISAVATTGLTLIITLQWGRQQDVVDLRPSLRYSRTILNGSLPYWFNTGIFVIYLWIDSVILSIMARPQEVGWYGVSTRLFSTLLFIPTIVGTAWYPRLVDAFQARRDQFFTESRPFIDFLLVLSIPVTFGTIVAAAPVMHALYGPTYDNAVPVMVILALCLPLTYLGTGLYQLMSASGRTNIMTWLLAISLPVNVVSNIVLIHVFDLQDHNGALGSAISLLITEVIITSGGFLVLGRHVLNRSSVWRLVRAVACGGCMWTVAYESRSLGSITSLVAAAVTFCVGAIVLKVLSPEERTTALGACSKVWSRVLPRRATQ